MGVEVLGLWLPNPAIRFNRPPFLHLSPPTRASLVTPASLSSPPPTIQATISWFTFLSFPFLFKVFPFFLLIKRLGADCWWKKYSKLARKWKWCLWRRRRRDRLVRFWNWSLSLDQTTASCSGTGFFFQF